MPVRGADAVDTPCTPGELVMALLQHGSNPIARERGGRRRAGRAGKRREKRTQREQQLLEARRRDSLARDAGKLSPAPRHTRPQARDLAPAAKLRGDLRQRFQSEHVVVARRAENRAEPAELLLKRREGFNRSERRG